MLRNGDPEPGGIVWLTKVDNFLALGCDGDCGNGTVQLTSRRLIDKPLERRLLELATQMQLLSDMLPEIDAEPGPLALIVFHGEGWRIFRPDLEYPLKVYPWRGWGRGLRQRLDGAEKQRGCYQDRTHRQNSRSHLSQHSPDFSGFEATIALLTGLSKATDTLEAQRSTEALAVLEQQCVHL
jgi:hypothetical protein